MEIFGPGEHLLQRNIGNRVFDNDFSGLHGSFLFVIRRWFAFFLFGAFPLRPGVNLVAEDSFRRGVTPVAERAFGVLHDVPLMHQRDALSLVAQGVFNRRFYETNRANIRDGLDPKADLDRHVANVVVWRSQLHVTGHRLLSAEADFCKVLRKFLCEKIEHLLRFGRSADIFDARVNIFRVFAEDNHVDLFRMFHRRGNAREVLDGAKANIEVEHLSEGDVQGTNAATDRSGEGTFDSDEIFLEGLDRVVWQPVVEFVLGGFAREHFEPGDLAFAAVGLFHRCVENALARRPDIRSGAVTADERNDRVFWNVKFSVLNRDFPACWRSHIFISHGKIRVRFYGFAAARARETRKRQTGGNPEPGRVNRTSRRIGVFLIS